MEQLLVRSLRQPPAVFQDDGLDAAKLAFFYREQEELHYLLLLSQTPQQWQRNELTWFRDDEFSTKLANVAIEPQDPMPAEPPVEWVPWVNVSYQNFPEEGLDSPGKLAFFYRDQTDQWLNPPPVTTAPWSDAFFSDDEATNFSTVAGLDDESAPPSATAATASPRFPGPFADDEISTSLAFFFLEQEEPWTPLVETVSWCARPFLDDEVQAYFFLEQEEAWWNGVPSVQSLPWLPRPFLYDEFSTSLANTAADPQEPWVAQTQTISWVGRVSLDQEELGGQFYIEQEEPPWFGVPPVQSVPWLARPFADDETSTSLANTAADPQDQWPLPPATTLVAWWGRSSLDDEALGGLQAKQLDDESAWPVLVTAAPWCARPFSDDETSAGLADFFLEQEEPWVAQTTTLSWAARPFLDDEISAQLANFFREQEDAWPPQGLPPLLVTRNPWAAFVSADEDAGAGLSYFFLEQEDDWNRQVTAIAWTPHPFLDDEFSTSLANLHVEEDYASFPVQSIAWSPRPSLDDEILGYLIIPLHVDEEYWPDGVRGAASCVWLGIPPSLDEDPFVYVVAGPYRTVAGDAYSPGTEAFSSFGPGANAGDSW